MLNKDDAITPNFSTEAFEILPSSPSKKAFTVFFIFGMFILIGAT
jgi:hypothetical protein